MRKQLRSFALLLVLCLSFGVIGVRADNEWSEEYYRAWDSAGELSNEERDDLDRYCLDFVATHQVDLAMLSALPEDYVDRTLASCAQEYYQECDFGYGTDRSGFLFAFDMETGEAILLAFGGAGTLIDEGELAAMATSAMDHYGEYGIFGVMYAAYRQLDNRLGGAPADIGTAVSETRENSAVIASGMPYWYPADTQQFTFFHDDTAPRVVDDADILTASEERRMESRLAELRAELGRDIVVFTDNSTHGLSRAVYAADFYDFNGYGIGDEREGFCLFICMEEGNRGFWTCGTGSDTKSLHTEDVANALDDVLYEYMASGQYAAGIEDWIENIRTLYRTGMPFAPKWYPERGSKVERFHDASAARVTDELDVLSASEISELERRIAELSQKYGIDFVVHLSRNPVGISEQQFEETYYRVMGYGLGSDYDGIQMTIYDNGLYWSGCHVGSYGGCAGKLSDTARERLEERCDDRIYDGVYKALDEWLSQTEHVLKTGRAPRSLGSWLKTALLGLLGGTLVGGIALAGAKRRMRTPRILMNADAYVVRGGLRVAKVRDDFTGTTTSRRYHPPQRESSGSSGGSSYSSSYSGSSGASHSGSGRSF
jgi:uncharacterized membrane protein YgcG